jgi:hypothetical protein
MPPLRACNFIPIMASPLKTGNIDSSHVKLKNLDFTKLQLVYLSHSNEEQLNPTPNSLAIMLQSSALVLVEPTGTFPNQPP